MVIRVLVLKVWFESRSWVQQARSRIGEVSMVTAEEVNSDCWAHRAQIVKTTTVAVLFFHRNNS